MKALKYLLLTTAAISLILAALPHPFLIGLLALSEHSLWQPLTYFLAEPSVDGLSFSFIISLFFNCYLLWTFGAQLLSKIGARHLFILYAACGILAGGAGMALLTLTGGHAVVMGLSSVLFGLSMGWLMFFPHFELVFLFAFRLKAKWCVAGMMALSLLSSFSAQDFIGAAVHMSGALVGYIYMALCFNLRSPFALTAPVDKLLNTIGRYVRKKRGPQVLRGKIIDIRSLEK